jgi:hypothetical protein
MMFGLGFLPMRPAADELLSSFLVRVARLNGSSPYRFYSHWLGRRPLWERDIDRTLTSETARHLAELFGWEVKKVQSLSLQEFEAPLCSDGAPFRQGIGPWINAAGIYHRVRGRHGLQYCPDCLLEPQAAFVRQWRRSFVAACPTHRQILADACPLCDEPVILHRSHGSPRRCHKCQTFLGGRRSRHRYVIGELLELQALLGADACRTLPRTLRRTSSRDRLLGLHNLFSVLRVQGNGYRPEARSVFDVRANPELASFR